MSGKKSPTHRAVPVKKTLSFLLLIADNASGAHSTCAIDHNAAAIQATDGGLEQYVWHRCVCDPGGVFVGAEKDTELFHAELFVPGLGGLPGQHPGGSRVVTLWKK